MQQKIQNVMLIESGDVYGRAACERGGLVGNNIE